MGIIVKIVKWAKKVGGTVKSLKSLKFSTGKDYIDNIRNRVIFIQYFILPWTLAYEKKRTRDREIFHRLSCENYKR